MPAFFSKIKPLTDRMGQAKGLLLMTIAVVVLILAWLWFSNDDEKIIYTSVPVTRSDIENLVTATGILQPRDYVDVGAQVSGQLKRLHVEVGSEVKTGDLLAEIDATVYLAKVDGTRAQLRNQRAQLLDRQAQLTLAQVNFTRQKNLQKEDATTQESLETAEASLQSAKAQIMALEAQIEQIESSLRAEEANLEFARIYAPMDGTVVSITSRQGQTLNTNQMAPTLLRIADLSVMTVQAQVSEADVGKLRQDMPVYFTTLGSEGRRWVSKLDRIEPTPTVLNNVVLYNALFDVPNANRLLMTQMTTQVFFITAEANDVLTLPVSALKFERSDLRGSKKSSVLAKTDVDANNPQKTSQSNQNRPAISALASAEPTATRAAEVRVMKSKNVIETRQVEVGVSNRIQAEIISGVTEGEMIITGVQKPKSASDDPARSFGPRMMR